MELKLYQVDAFTQTVFKGNPAAVCPLEAWLPDAVLQHIAAENNLSETAFYVANESDYSLRWFTPVREVDLCGHATMACAWVIFEIDGYLESEISFSTRSGLLTVRRARDGLLTMSFPKVLPGQCTPPPGLNALMSEQIDACYETDDLILVLKRAEQVASARFDMALLKALPYRGVSISAAADDFDFVSRFFAPRFGIDEDPVTGSTFCYLAPLWASRLGRTNLRAKQVSARGGEVQCEVTEYGVNISGHCALYLSGVLQIDQV